MTSPTMRCVGTCTSVLTVLLTACGSDAHLHTSKEAIADAGFLLADAAPAEDRGDAADYKGCDANVPVFTIGMQAQGMAAKIEGVLIAASPAPPEQFRNDWTVEFRGQDGQPLRDVSVTKAGTFMPLHGHPGATEPLITALPQAGQFKLERLSLTMRGTWQIQLTVSSPSAGDDYIVFYVCLPE